MGRRKNPDEIILKNGKKMVETALHCLDLYGQLHHLEQLSLDLQNQYRDVESKIFEVKAEIRTHHRHFSWEILKNADY